MVPLARCEPLVSNVSGAVSVVGLAPLGALPSARIGSPCAVKETVTLSVYQPPLPAKSNGRSAAAVGVVGDVRSTLICPDSPENSLSPLSLISFTRYVHMPSSSGLPAVKTYGCLLKPVATVVHPGCAFWCCRTYVRRSVGPGFQLSEKGPLLGLAPLDSNGALGVVGGAMWIEYRRPRDFWRLMVRLPF